jgi:hypothetical protein
VLVSGLLIGLSLSFGIGIDCWAVTKETSAEKERHLKQQANPGLFNAWNFDKDQVGEIPKGFSASAAGAQPGASWIVQPAALAPSSPNVLVGTSACGDCMQLLVADGLQYEYPDLAVRLHPNGATTAGPVGVVFGVKDGNNFYAAMVDFTKKSLEVVRVMEGQATVLGQAPIKLKPVDWHTLRVQRNTIISKDFIETFFDGQLAVSVEDQQLGVGLVGLLLRGQTAVHFDNFNAAPLYSHRPFSPPAAY